MNAFKRRKDNKKSASTDNLSEHAKKENDKPTFESIVQRIMRMRINAGVVAENEPPPDISMKGARVTSPSTEADKKDLHRSGRTKSNRRRVIIYVY